MVNSNSSSPKKMKRLVSLDFFRGLTIALMIVVNTPGSWRYVYPPLRHADWNGLTPTDLVFPFFLFIVGVSISLAYRKNIETGVIESATYRKIIIRTIKIFLVGIFLALFPEFHFAELRIAGVLQRIAIVFLVCSVLFLKTGWKGQTLACIALLVGYWLSMMFIPVPGYGSGVLEPGQNLAAYIDQFLLPGRMYRETWDPEGLYSTLPAIGTGITGMLAGHIILSNKLSQHQKIIWLFFGGLTAFVIGYMWGWTFPVNKNLWTSSYVMVCSGLATMFLAASIWIIDEQGYKKWTYPAVVFGMNAITAYVLSGILWEFFNIPLFVGKGIKDGWMDMWNIIGAQPEMASFLWALTYTGFCYLFVWILYKRRIFIKL